jgi:hypothetical protein
VMSRLRFATLLAVAAAATLLPAGARADRGALTLEGGGFFAIDSVPPAVGVGPAVTGRSYGGILGVRYALTNALEVSASGFYEAPGTYYHANTTYTNSTSVYPGTLESRTSSWGLMAGGRWVGGLVWRYFIGGEVGFGYRSYSSLDLINVSNPGSPQSYGLTDIPDSVGTVALLVSPLAGIEWFITDHISLALAPRVQVYLGAQSEMRFIVPVVFAYSWYPF